MGYKAKYRPTVHLDFSHIGDNNGVPFFVDIKNPRLLTFEEKLEIGEASKKLNGAFDKKAMKEATRKLILNWNLLDKDSESPVDFNSEDALDHVPGEIAEIIMLEFKPAKEDDEEVKNSSAQLDKSSVTDQLQGA